MIIIFMKSVFLAIVQRANPNGDHGYLGAIDRWLGRIWGSILDGFDLLAKMFFWCGTILQICIGRSPPLTSPDSPHASPEELHDASPGVPPTSPEEPLTGSEASTPPPPYTVCSTSIHNIILFTIHLVQFQETNRPLSPYSLKILEMGLKINSSGA